MPEMQILFDLKIRQHDLIFQQDHDQGLYKYFISFPGWNRENAGVVRQTCGKGRHYYLCKGPIMDN